MKQKMAEIERGDMGEGGEGVEVQAVPRRRAALHTRVNTVANQTRFQLDVYAGAPRRQGRARLCQENR